MAAKVETRGQIVDWTGEVTAPTLPSALMTAESIMRQQCGDALAQFIEASAKVKEPEPIQIEGRAAA